jgi:hypothetical protein
MVDYRLAQMLAEEYLQDCGSGYFTVVEFLDDRHLLFNGLSSVDRELLNCVRKMIKLKVFL